MPHRLSGTVRASFALGLMRLALVAGIAGRRPGANLSELVAVLLLLCGAWTRVVSSLIAALEMWRTLAGGGGWVSLLLAAMAAALALMGPGGWSVDARLLGWRRIDIPGTRKGGSR